MRFCPQCGTRLSDAASFCPTCGQRVRQLAHQPAQGGPGRSRESRFDRIDYLVIAGGLLIACTVLGIAAAYELQNQPAEEKAERETAWKALKHDWRELWATLTEFWPLLLGMGIVSIALLIAAVTLVRYWKE